ncbi:MAG TPA: tRNA (N6-isopentenyl adenosine(37)-C2)-methylthiotransferase MiaB [Gemmatimonadota bacterium]|jgi:tRNA-2-methylthio-N6-dimethylallyladenosine synthase|nr:tRNA (N6-isopentenyl adenosine(37)-C2)-methylthiotransferase MiaB [Gemmatimonadota bacterium]
MALRFYIETYGCQMNVADSELMGGVLNREGHLRVEDPGQADVLIVNTCAIREHAEQRVIGRIGELNRHKLDREGVRLGVAGCVAKELGRELLDRASYVDFVVGPDSYRHLPEILDKVGDGERVVYDRFNRSEGYEDLEPLRLERFAAWITIMRGCDKFCSYCIVPFTRGREKCRSLEGIVAEVRRAVRAGAKEVTLLGQNVNSYKDAGRDFPDLLKAVAAVEGLARVRFTTSHPWDFTERLVDAIASHENVMNHVHLPVQSGSDRILAAMRREHTAAWYLERIEMLRRAIPDCALTTDVIVGFPGETDADFRATLELMEEVRYNSAYVFIYSPRPHTPAADLTEERVAHEVAVERLEALNGLQRTIGASYLMAKVGTTEEVLVQGPARRGEGRLTGWTEHRETVVFPGDPAMVGEIVPVEIEALAGITLHGRSRRTVPEERAVLEIPVLAG